MQARHSSYSKSMNQGTHHNHRASRHLNNGNSQCKSGVNIKHVGPTTHIDSTHSTTHGHNSGKSHSKSLNLREISRTINFWRHLTNFWTVVFFAFIIADFVLDNYFDKHGIILTIAAVYGAALAVYSTEKEFKRWSDEHTNVHPGEIYIALWTILIFTLIILGIVMDKHYHMPPEVSSSYIVVIGILAITKESKKQYRRKKQK